MGDAGRGERSASRTGAPDSAILGSLERDPQASALLLDFDGTLSPIVERPSMARPVSGAIAVLRELQTRLGCVAVLSGRPLEFLTDLVPEGIDLAGLDGLQRRVRGVVVEDPRVRAFGHIVEETAREAERLLPGVLVERKSNISVALHWRTARHLQDRVLEISRRLSDSHGLVVQEGRSVVELRPRIPIDKGVVSTELVRGFRHAAFIGDDATDLLAFEALLDLRRRGSLHSLTLVAVENDEAPSALLRLADAVTESPLGVVAYLEDLARRLRTA